MTKRIVVLLVMLAIIPNAYAQNPTWLDPFVELFAKDPGEVYPCQSNSSEQFYVCSSKLRNQGNAPYVLHHTQATEKTVVLFHGLSDSPYFLRSIASALHQEGYTVIVGLLPGHGLKDADDEMEDSDLGQRWKQRVADTVDYARSFSKTVYIGGFSTGGTLATLYSLEHPQDVDALLLFSGALALDESVENMAHIWGFRWLARVLDGDYKTDGPNPYKYPQVSKHAALILVDLIEQIRDNLTNGIVPELAVFSAHSMADDTTPWRGIELLQSKNKGSTVTFKIDQKYDVCHADVVVNEKQLNDMHFDISKLSGEPEKCSIPKANPVHAQMIEALQQFLSSINKG